MFLRFVEKIHVEREVLTNSMHKQECIINYKQYLWYPPELG